MEKSQKYVDGLVAKACKQQGGAVRGQGANSAKTPKKSGDSGTFYTAQDRAGGKTKNKFHDV